MPFMAADFYVQRALQGRCEVSDAVGHGTSGRVVEPYSIWCKERAGVFARDFPITRYDEVGGNEFLPITCSAFGYGECLFVDSPPPGD